MFWLRQILNSCQICVLVVISWRPLSTSMCAIGPPQFSRDAIFICSSSCSTEIKINQLMYSNIQSFIRFQMPSGRQRLCHTPRSDWLKKTVWKRYRNLVSHPGQIELMEATTYLHDCLTTNCCFTRAADCSDLCSRRLGSLPQTAVASTVMDRMS